MLTGKRAAAGGEIGANGEWYRGGTFIATTEAPKGTYSTQRTEPLPPSPEELERRAAAAAREAKLFAWVASRKVANATVITCLRAAHSEFYESLADQLENFGHLSYKQSGYATKLVMGRETKKNSDAWCDLFDSLLEKFNDE